MAGIFRTVVDGLAIVVVLIAGIILIRVYLANDSYERLPDIGPAERESTEWFFDLALSGNRIGSATAPVVAVVFSNYYCGYCASFETTLRSLQARYSQHLAVVYKHFLDPSSLGEYPIPLAVECAADQGSFSEYHEAAFRSNKLRGYSEGWRLLADSAGIPDQEEFDVCVRGRKFGRTISSDYAAGKELGVAGTPTFFINGEGPYVGDASLPRLDSLVARHFRGRDER